MNILLLFVFLSMLSIDLLLLVAIGNDDEEESVSSFVVVVVLELLVDDCFREIDR